MTGIRAITLDAAAAIRSVSDEHLTGRQPDR